MDYAADETQRLSDVGPIFPNVGAAGSCVVGKPGLKHERPLEDVRGAAGLRNFNDNRVLELEDEFSTPYIGRSSLVLQFFVIELFKLRLPYDEPDVEIPRKPPVPAQSF